MSLIDSCWILNQTKRKVTLVRYVKMFDMFDMNVKKNTRKKSYNQQQKRHFNSQSTWNLILVSTLQCYNPITWRKIWPSSKKYCLMLFLCSFSMANSSQILRKCVNFINNIVIYPNIWNIDEIHWKYYKSVLSVFIPSLSFQYTYSFEEALFLK